MRTEEVELWASDAKGPAKRGGVGRNHRSDEACDDVLGTTRGRKATVDPGIALDGRPPDADVRVLLILHRSHLFSLELAPGASNTPDHRSQRRLGRNLAPPECTRTKLGALGRTWCGQLVNSWSREPSDALVMR